MQPDTQQQREGAATHGLAGDKLTGADAAIAAEYRRQAHSGANWFFWIAGFSVVNSIILLANGQWNFLIGLGLTQLIDGVATVAAERMGGAATGIALILDAMVAGFFIVMGLLARRGFGWAFVLGMVVYVLDGLLFLYVQQWLNIAFHGLALYYIYRGFAANSKLRTLQAEAAFTPPPPPSI
ncbi:MAG TPA: hypothetical protein VGO96_08320 [Pyrinomonadaceae bacterium]|jgi:hypothetical protein|nr:hypothetical protein [Pyrinomonadaceae bacterium]